MRLAEKSDSEKTPDEMDIPEELSRRQDRLIAIAIAKAKEKIEQRAGERYVSNRNMKEK
ncbi:hypothetical protein JWG39_10645 [Desulforhopalus vacuolatus]|nr:hypothetical protein [Desulforhopalus vacuolatus]MBM9520272.1 hypothetical protein [Desulforhopalus vacuolatus]